MRFKTLIALALLVGGLLATGVSPSLVPPADARPSCAACG
jgi:hypothetical protein